MTQMTADVPSDQLTRDLAFIIDLEHAPLPAVRRQPFVMPTLGSAKASTTIGFSALAVLLAGTAVSVANNWPVGDDGDAASVPSLRRVPSAAPSTVANVPAPPSGATPGTLRAATPTVAAMISPDRPAIIDREPVRQVASIASVEGRVTRAGSPAGERTRLPARPRAVEPDRSEMTATRFARAEPPVAEVSGVGGRTIESPVARVAPPVLAAATRAPVAVPGSAGAPAASAAMNPAPVPTPKLRAARRDAQDALVGLRRQL